MDLTLGRLQERSEKDVGNVDGLDVRKQEHLSALIGRVADADVTLII